MTTRIPLHRRGVPWHGGGGGECVKCGLHHFAPREYFMRLLWTGADVLRQTRVGADAEPAFLLDSRRQRGERPVSEGMFDNRWVVFPTDFPLGRMLLERGIDRAVLVMEGADEPAGDLSHVLLRWQEAGVGIALLRLDQPGEGLRRIAVRRPAWFRVAWYQMLATMGLRPRLLGGFGGKIAESGGAG